MKIKKEYKGVSIGELELGSCFFYNGGYYILAGFYNCDYLRQAVNIEDGTIMKVTQIRGPIYPVDVEIVIKEFMEGLD